MRKRPPIVERMEELFTTYCQIAINEHPKHQAVADLISDLIPIVTLADDLCRAEASFRNAPAWTGRRNESLRLTAKRLRNRLREKRE